MTLLRLSPDGERLRRIAKAHAAGELSTPDYRRIRSDVIESFAQAGAADVSGDDTQQRWLERPAPLPPIADHVMESARSPEAALTARPLRRPLVWLGVGVAFAIAVAAVMA